MARTFVQTVSVWGHALIGFFSAPIIQWPIHNRFSKRTSLSQAISEESMRLYWLPVLLLHVRVRVFFLLILQITNFYNIMKDEAWCRFKSLGPLLPARQPLCKPKFSIDSRYERRWERLLFQSFVSTCSNNSSACLRDHTEERKLPNFMGGWLSKVVKN